MEIRTIPIDQVRDDARLRPVDPDWAELLKDRIGTEGLLQPIAVRAAGADGTYALIFGGHRLAACRLLGWSEIPARVLDVSELQARLMEIEENLVRAELNPLDRAMFLAEHKTVWEALHPETRHGGQRRGTQPDDRGQNGHLKIAQRFTALAQEKFGFSERTVRRAVAMAKALSPEVRGIIAGTPASRSATELEALSKLVAPEQAVVARMLRDGTAETVQEAVRKTRRLPLNLPENVDDAQLRKLLADWRKSGAKARRTFLQALADEGTAFPEAKK